MQDEKENPIEPEVEGGMTTALLDDIIERLKNHDQYPGYTINETKGGGTTNVPYILKEKEIRLLIQTAERVFKE